MNIGNLGFLAILGVSMAGLFIWAFRVLTREHWQFIASVPVSKDEDGQWTGLNLTFYGFFQASSNAFAVAALFFLLGSVGVAARATSVMVVLVVGLCWWAASAIARLVEGKKHTFTVGGAAFAGAFVTPLVVLGLNRLPEDLLGSRIPLVAALAAVSIAYAYGEAIGRLACISFGCCYGRRIDEVSPLLAKLLSPIGFIFTGPTRKAVYAGKLEGVRLVPIQAITSVVFSIIALTATYFYLSGRFVSALFFAGGMTQLWRFVSEQFRADLRGPSKQISAYQVMALILAFYLPCIGWITGGEVMSPVAALGAATLWSPMVIVFCQVIWLAVFLVTGRSSVTGSKLSLTVHLDRI